MKLKFELSDFEYIDDPISCVDQANAKLEAYIKEHGVEVFGFDVKSEGSSWVGKKRGYHDTHKAILINIEPLDVECKHNKLMLSKHESDVDLLTGMISGSSSSGVFCLECLKKLTPTGGWKVEE